MWPSGVSVSMLDLRNLSLLALLACQVVDVVTAAAQADRALSPEVKPPPPLTLKSGGISKVTKPTDPNSVNPHNFTYTILPTDVCSGHHQDVFLLAVVHTAPPNYKRRMFIRESYGNHVLYEKLKMITVFFMGATTEQKIQKSVEQEADRYHDIVQEDFHDSYRNLTYKQIMWLKWGGTYCPSAKYTLKVDDDLFVNIFALSKKILRDYQQPNLKNRCIFCAYYGGTMPVMRTGKWSVPKEDYHNDKYGEYCSGSAYLLTQDLLLPMYYNSLKTKFFWVDDFYATGLLPRGLNVTYHDRGSLYTIFDKIERQYFHLVNGYRIFSHTGNTRMKERMWRGLLTRYELNHMFGLKPLKLDDPYY